MNSTLGAPDEYHHAQLQLALQASETGLWNWDIASDSTTWTPWCFRIAGVDPDLPPPAGRAFFAMIHPEDRERVRTALRTALRTRQPYHCEFRLLRPDGSCRWVVNQGLGLYTAEGCPQRMLGTLRDVTERKRRDAALEESEAQFRATFENAAVGIAVVAPDGRWLAVNDRLCHIVGHTRAQLLAGRYQDITHPDDLPAVQDLLNRLLSGELARHSVEKRYLRKDGVEVWVNVSASLRRDARGEPLNLIAVIEDISARRSAEMRLMASQERLAQAQQPAQVGTWDWALGTGQASWSEQAWQLYGRAPQDGPVSYAQWLSCVHPDDRLRAAQAVREAACGRPYADEYRVQHPDGTVLWLQAQAEVVRDARGEPVRMVGTVRNITEHKRTEAAQEAAARQKDEFLATLAHELRNPLAPLRSGLEVLKRVDLEHPAARRVRDAMERQLGHLVRLVDDLLDISRISLGKVALQRGPITVAAIIAHALEGSRMLVDLHGHALRVEIPDRPLFVDGDLTRLAQVVGNLVNNAAKYTPQGGHITVEAIAQGETVSIVVSDDGMGMQREMLSRAFEMFIQAEEARGRAQGGLGIGLALVRKLTELHGGSVHAQSEGLGRGSRFTVTLPLLPSG